MLFLDIRKKALICILSYRDGLQFSLALQGSKISSNEIAKNYDHTFNGNFIF